MLGTRRLGRRTHDIVRVLAVAGILLLAGPGTVRAQEHDEEEEREHRSEQSTRDMDAGVVSAIWTLIPVTAGLAVGLGGEGKTTTTISGVLLWGGAIVGPATGYWYGDVGKKAVPGLIVRGATFALVSALAPTDDGAGGMYPTFHGGDDDGKQVAWIAASSVIAASAVFDILRAERAVREHEQPEIHVSPWIDAREGSVGFAVATRF